MQKGDKKMINILVVDDEEAIANLIKTTLNKAGYVCRTVYDGDPLSDGEMRGYDKKLVEKRYIEMGCEAVVVY